MTKHAARDKKNNNDGSTSDIFNNGIFFNKRNPSSAYFFQNGYVLRLTFQLEIIFNEKIVSMIQFPNSSQKTVINKVRSRQWKTRDQYYTYKIGIQTALSILNNREMFLLHYRGYIIIQNIFMKNSLNNSLICEQIDVAVMGPKSLQIIEALIRHDLPTKSCEQSNSYLSILRELFSEDEEIKPKLPTRKLNTDKKLHKFSTNVCTESFWLQFSFYLMEEKAYDPLLAPITKNGISICIIANDEETPNGSHLKSLVTTTTVQLQSSRHNYPQNYSEQQQTLPKGTENIKSNNFTKSRSQLLLESKILNQMHEMHINEFTSVLALKVFQNGRIVEETNNLRLNRNQVLRWILDRHFENCYRIKLKEELSDELEIQYEEQPEKNCQLI